MAKKTKGLQKLTDLDAKVKSLLALERITVADLDGMNDEQRQYFARIVQGKLSTLKGEEYDELVEKMWDVTMPQTRNDLWHRNHNKITIAISNHIQQYGRMPSTSDIAEASELSRQTIHKHIREFSAAPQLAEIKQQFAFMSEKVLAMVFKYAVQGDIRAAKLYFDIAGGMNMPVNQNNTLIQNQNNFIQINGITISQEQLQQLQPEQLRTIESIFTTALPTENRPNNNNI